MLYRLGIVPAVRSKTDLQKGEEGFGVYEGRIVSAGYLGVLMGMMRAFPEHWRRLVFTLNASERFICPALRIEYWKTSLGDKVDKLYISSLLAVRFEMSEVSSVKLRDPDMFSKVSSTIKHESSALKTTPPLQIRSEQLWKW
nr:hypothetical protein CFP56_11333 [Quercus suber]